MPAETAKTILEGVFLRSRDDDRPLATLAARQHGVVGRLQLIDAGWSGGAIEKRIRSGRLHRLYAGVYAVGHRVTSREGRWMAAVLASGPDAVLSHWSAAAFWMIRPNSRSIVDITTPRKSRSWDGIRRHHKALPADEVTVEEGIPVTTVPRTILDLAATESADVVGNLLRESEYRQLRDRLSLWDLVERYPGRPGVRKVRIALERLTEEPAGRQHSRLEERFVADLRALLKTDPLRAGPQQPPPAEQRLLRPGCGSPRNPQLITSVCDNVRTVSKVATQRVVPADATASAAGRRIKALREAMGFSLRDLTERSGVSAPMLSQVERGETSPTLAVAEKIAAGLELTLSQLLRLDEGEHVAVSRAAERRRYERGGHRFEELTPPLPGQRADVSLHTLKAGATTGGPDDPPMHEPGSRETAVVLTGVLALTVDGTRHELHAGDSVTFDADLPHHFENDGEEQARFLAVIAAGLRRS
jgi:transcriptional regulator with XRE-family HTH domain